MTPLAELQRIAAAYPPEARHTPADDRERYFTPVQRRAWDMRFASRPEPSAIIGAPSNKHNSGDQAHG